MADSDTTRDPIRVAVLGAAGRMGATVCRAVLDAPDMELVAVVDPPHEGRPLDDFGVAGTGLTLQMLGPSVKAAQPSVAVDFTHVEAARGNLRWCGLNGVHAVVGTTGLTSADFADLAGLFNGERANAVVAPNFAIGAVLMMQLAAIAAPWFESAEIIELHHDNKVDAPSGTALLTAERIAETSTEWTPDPTKTVAVDGARGGEGPAGIRIHSVRLRGLVAHQEVLLGTTGQSLTIRHDSYDRTSFMPGVLLAVREVANRPGVTVGLDTLLGFGS
ncbi:MAG TPA: 4-hydroxy-tetrahydrodipicolinate reductase [Acidimicrobiia bacterium]|nr:4-hydroxy-tetrahydrodipicolinate reductase [Acidimicrobiia bacterium]HZQ77202.1 4-hydroxy-tetrahydrodipicolinate reductase [Acidimicrobiia bacterium]